MKKLYVMPQVKEVKIKMEQHVCAGTVVSVGANPKDEDWESDAKGDDGSNEW